MNKITGYPEIAEFTMLERNRTFLFTDIEGSTRIWEQFPDEMRMALAGDDDLLREAIMRWGGQVFKTIGDAFCAVFDLPENGLAAALRAQQALCAEPWGVNGHIRVRMAIHDGPADERDEDYFGPTLNRGARLLAIGHGGQTLVSESSFSAIGDSLPPGTSLDFMGSHRLKDLGKPRHGSP